MKNSILIAFLFIIYSCGGVKVVEEKSTLNKVDLAIENVNIFNSKTKEILKNKTILIKNDSISAIIENNAKNYDAKNTIHGKGKLVTPGFIDTHVHLSQIFGDGNETAPEFIEDHASYRQVLTQQYLQYGTTTILDLGQPEKWLTVSMKWQNTPSPHYPNIYNSGGALISDLGREPNMNHAEILGENHAKEKIKAYADKGIKHIKLYSHLNEADLKYVVAEANTHKLSIFGHLDRGEVNVSKAMELELKNFKHFFTLINAVLNTSEHSAKLNHKYKLGETGTVDEWTAKMILYFDYIDSTPELKSQLNNLIERMVTNKVNISTTISVLASVAQQSDFFSSFTTYPLRTSPHFPNYSTIDKSSLKKAFQSMMKYVKKANESGLKIRIGTDCKYGGQALLNELMLLAEADIPIADILQMATWNGAEAMKIGNQYGVIEVGKIADLIIFKKNPFDDYQHFLSEKTIIKSGQIFQPKKSITKDMLEIITNRDVKEAIEWYENTANHQEYYPYHEPQLNELAAELFKINKAKEAVDVLRFCLNKFGNSNTPYNRLSEQQLNGIGYDFLYLEDISGALEIFKLNTELFPESWNVYDSLGETYGLLGNLKLAKENYHKSLKINPKNDYATKALKRMGK